MLRPLTASLAAALLAGEPSPSSAGPGFPTADDLSVLELAERGQAGQVYVLERDDRCIGTLGVAGALSPDGEQEIGYGLVPRARGQGLGTEAVGALCAVLERGPDLRRLTAQVRAGNDASLALLRRLGFVEVDGAAAGHRKLARAAPGQPPLRARIPGRHVC